jgi:hypothetical protein
MCTVFCFLHHSHLRITASTNQICTEPTLSAVSAYERFFCTGIDDPEWPDNVYKALKRDVLSTGTHQNGYCQLHPGFATATMTECVCGRELLFTCIRAFAAKQEVEAALDVMRARTVRKIVQYALSPMKPPAEGIFIFGSRAT